MTTELTSHEAKDWREGRRLRAWELHQEGWTQVRIAEALGVSQGAVSQWLKRAAAQGVQALRRQPAPGATPRLTAAQRAQIPALLQRGAEAWGFRGAVWTCPRVAVILKDTFGVRYHPSHVSRLLRAVGWSRQKPKRRARQRDEVAIDHWRNEEAPALKKKP